MSTRLGLSAVERLLEGGKNECVGMINNTIHFTSFKEAVDKYLASEFWKGVKSNPNLVNFEEDVYEIAPFSKVSNGIPRMPSTNR